MENTAAIFMCSHRAGGNSFDAANLFRQGVEEAGGEAFIYKLKKFRIEPCTACGVCAKDEKHRCPLDGKDFARELFTALKVAPFVFFAAPIYFYHLPSIFKTWIDRSQMHWCAWDAGDEGHRALPERPAYTCLVAGRDRGDKLFDGALLTMKYFLRSFNLHLADPMTLLNTDKAGDLRGNEAAAAALVEMGRNAWLAHAAKKD